MVVIGAEEDIIAKQEGDATSIITTTEAPIGEDAEITEGENNEGLQITEATTIEYSRPGSSMVPGNLS